MRLLLVHTGGTLMMRGGGSHPLTPQVEARDLLHELPMLREIAEIETRVAFELDSSDMQPHHWVELASLLHTELPRYDGAVVVHGTDTMAYTASALAFLLPGIARPIVLTGSQNPLENVRTDARANLVDACQMATMPIPEVGIVFGSQLLRGCRSTKLDAWGLHPFGSPGCAPLAELGVGVRTGPHVLAPRPPQPFDPRIETRVLAVRTHPGLDPHFLERALDAGVRGVVLEAFGAGNVPTRENALIPFVRAASASDVPVVIVSQCYRGGVDLARYEGGSEAARAGAISGDDMTSEAALAKLTIALGRADAGRAIESVRAAFAASWAGEITRP